MTIEEVIPEEWATDAARWPEAILELRAKVDALEAKYETMRLATLEWGKDVDTHARLIDKLWKRVETLQPEPIDEAENDRRFHACMDLIHNATPEQIRAAAGLPERPASKVYEINEPLQLTPEQAQQVRDLLAPNSKPAPDSSRIGSSLVERVSAAIHPSICADPYLYLHEARAAICEVAAHIRQNASPNPLIAGWIAAWLEQEALPDD